MSVILRVAPCPQFFQSDNVISFLPSLSTLNAFMITMKASDFFAVSVLIFF